MALAGFAVAALAACGAAHASLSAGSIAFTLYNTDANDDFSFVALAPIAGGTTIYFRDDEWNGTSFNDANESTLSWTAPASGVAAGEVILFTEIAVAARGVNVGTLATPGSANFGLNNTVEVLYAYTSTGDAFTGTFTFLSAITNGAAFGGSNGLLTGTGLTDGTTAFRLSPASADVGAYTGLRDNQTSFGDYLPQVYNLSNWTINAGGSGDQSGAFRPFNTTSFEIPAPGAIALGGLALVVGLRRRAR
jgi:uncharacterized protein (TIGR03382 family)